MKIIRHAFELISEILGEQRTNRDDSVRFASWCVAVPVANSGTLLLNNLTREFVLVDKDKDENEFLFKHWFLVPEEHDDLKLADEVREVVACMNQHDGITGYTILTTTDCNARCFYCFEQGFKRVNMSRQTALDVAEYIKKTAGKKVKFHWFGGEPLFNISVIDIITGELKKAGIEFESGMTSNGYLATDNVVKKAVENWNLKSVQITLDGTEEIYNERKAYVNSKGSAFLRVLDNIEKLLQAGIAVNVRLNLDMDNVEDLYMLSDLLADRFASYDKFGVYAHYIFDDDSGNPLCYSFDETYRENIMLSRYLAEKGLSHPSKLEKTIKTNQCMADTDSSIVITPTGDLYKCEHVGVTDKCGTIYEGITNQEIVEYWKKRPEDGEICMKCPMYVDCVRVEACPGSFPYCPQVVYDERMQKLKDSMLYTYEKYLETEQS